MKVPETAFQIIWTVAIVGVALAMGAIYGWQQSGLFGSIAFGIVGFMVGPQPWRLSRTDGIGSKHIQGGAIE